MRFVALTAPITVLLLLSGLKLPASVSEMTKRFTQIRKLTPPIAAPFARFGTSVAMDGNLLAVGAPGLGAGTTYLFDRNAGGPNNWGLVKTLTASDGRPGESFGGSVAVSGDVLVIAAYFAGIQFPSDGQGAVYVFERNTGGSNNWGQVAKLIAPDGKFLDYFGSAVSASYETILVGALGDDDPRFFGPGSAYVFERDTGGSRQWTLVKKLLPADLGPFQTFGRSVSIDKDVGIIGASDDSGVGAAYLFGRDTGGTNNWGQFKKLVADDPGRWFGWSVSLQGNTAAVGDPVKDIGPNPQEGAAYVFAAAPGGSNQWSESKALYSSNGVLAGHFGVSVALEGERLLVGTEYETGAAPQSGSAYLFERDPGRNDTWAKVQTLSAGDGAYRDRFGSAVSFHSIFSAVGAPDADTPTGQDEGAAYLFSLVAADLAVIATLAPDPVPSGADLSLTVTISNAGPDTATGVTLVTSIPTNAMLIASPFCYFTNGAAICEIGGLAPGRTATATLVIHATACDSILTNVSSAFANEPDPNITNNSVLSLSTLIDTEPPSLTCPVDQEVEFTTAAGASVFFTVGSHDNCSAVQVICDPSSGSVFPIGSNIVSCVAQDQNGNKNSCQFAVVVAGARMVKQHVLTEISALATNSASSSLDEQLNSSIFHLSASLDPGLWRDETHLKGLRAEDVFQQEKDAAVKLMNALPHVQQSWASLINDWVMRLVRADRLLAEVALQDARSANGDPRQIELARVQLMLGDKAVRSGELVRGIEHFRNACKLATRHINDVP